MTYFGCNSAIERNDRGCDDEEPDKSSEAYGKTPEKSIAQELVSY